MNNSNSQSHSIPLVGVSEPLGRPLWVAFLALFGAMTSFFLLAAAVPLYVASLGGDSSGAGLSTGVLLFAAVGAEIVTPALVHRCGRRAVIFAGFALLGLPALFLGAVTNTAALTALCAVRGIGFGVLAVAGGALIVSLAPPTRRGYVLGLYGIVATIPAVIALPLGVWLSAHVGFTALFLAGGVAALAGVASTPYVPMRDAQCAEPISLRAGVKEPRLLWPAVAFAATAMAAGVITTFLPIMTNHLDATTTAWALLIQALTGSFTRGLAGQVVHRIKGYQLLGGSVVLVSSGVMLLATDVHSATVILAMILFGAGFGAVQNASLGLMLDQVDERGYDTVNALWNLAYDLGWGVGASGFGLLAARLGYTLSFAAAAVTILLALGLSSSQYRRRRPSALESGGARIRILDPRCKGYFSNSEISNT